MPKQVVGQVVPDAKGQPVLQSLNEQLRRIWQAINALQGNSGVPTTASGQVIDGDLQVRGNVIIGLAEPIGRLVIHRPVGEVDITSLLDPIAQNMGQQCTELHILDSGAMTFYQNGDLLTGGMPAPTIPAGLIGVVQKFDSANVPTVGGHGSPPVPGAAPQTYVPIAYIKAVQTVRPSDSPTLPGALSPGTELTLAYPGLAHPYLDLLDERASPVNAKTVFNEQRATTYTNPFPSYPNIPPIGGPVHIYGASTSPIMRRGLTVSTTINAVATWIGLRQNAILAGAGNYTWHELWPVGATANTFRSAGEITPFWYTVSLISGGGTEFVYFQEPGDYWVTFKTLNTSAAGLNVFMEYNDGHPAPTTWEVMRTTLPTGVSGEMSSIVHVPYADIYAATVGDPTAITLPFIRLYHATVGAQRYGHAAQEQTTLLIHQIGGSADDPLR